MKRYNYEIVGKLMEPPKVKVADVIITTEKVLLVVTRIFDDGDIDFRRLNSHESWEKYDEADDGEKLKEEG